MITDEISKLPLQDKLRIMEAIWSDFAEHAKNFPISPEHQNLLDQRSSRVAEGKARLRDWDTVKHSIGQP